MKKSGLITVAITAAAALAVPAGASAHARVDAQSVAVHVERVDAALDRLEAGLDTELADLRAIKEARRQAAAAARESAIAARRAHSTKLRKRAASLLAVSAAAQDDIAERLTALIGEFELSTQRVVIELLPELAARRDDIVARLSGLADRLPARARARIAIVITSLSTDGVAVLDGLIAALENGSLATELRSQADDLLATVAGQIEEAIARLEARLPATLPESSRDRIREAVSHVAGALQESEARLQAVLAQLTPVLTEHGAELAEALSGLKPLIQSILGIAQQAFPPTADGGETDPLPFALPFRLPGLFPAAGA